MDADLKTPMCVLESMHGVSEREIQIRSHSLLMVLLLWVFVFSLVNSIYFVKKCLACFTFAFPMFDVEKTHTIY